MKVVVLILGIFFVTAAAAGASFQKQWLFKCHYSGQPGEACEVISNVCRYNLFTPLENLSAPPPAPAPRRCLDWMWVECSGRKLAEGQATHSTTAVSLPYTTLNYEALVTSTHESNIVMRYSSQAPGTANPFYISSWLQLPDTELRGYCEVYQPPMTGYRDYR